MKRKKLMLVDSMSIAHFHKYKYVQQSVDNIIEPFLNTILRLVQVHNPDIVVLGNDETKSRYRTEVLSSYKGTRLENQKKYTPKQIEGENLVRSLKKNLKLFQPLFIDAGVIGVECDDILGILYHSETLKEYDKVVITVDKDFLTTIKLEDLYNPIKEEYFTLDKCMGFNRNQYLAMQSVLGDAVDNIPKLKGVGKVTAFKLIDKYRSLKTLIESAPLDCKTEKDSLVRKALEQISTPEGKAQLKLTYSLVKIMKDTSLLNEQELNRYNDIVENILNFKLNEDIISEELDEYLLESNAFQAPQILHEIKEYLR